MKPIRVFVFMTQGMIAAMPEAMWTSLKFQIKSGIVHVLNVNASEVEVEVMNLDERDKQIAFPRILCCLTGKRQISMAHEIDKIIGDTLSALASYVEVFVNFADKFSAVEVATIMPTTAWDTYIKQFHTNAHVDQSPELLNGWTKYTMTTTTE